MVSRGQVRWVDLGQPIGSEPGFRRPVVVIQGDAFNRSRLQTVIVVVLTSNTALAQMPGNVFLPASATGLPKDGVVNVTALATVDRHRLEDEVVGGIPEYLMRDIDAGLREVLDV
ncbi:type II toxin-antitoxin system PemK/MazF family toxin [Agromyces bauzanensis]|uniref:mRNA interferase n=1 Tax=Agromyces bauzanensis TaxID=1308924 RepID=A0A917ULK6_9MICO|nr:type II toxin-antitoxin system PemK/MazF family toxin [Agromyces bauzanensis]GGJ66992.1 endoribonuclease MazF2 [Agromyces bauzanensis]